MSNYYTYDPNRKSNRKEIDFRFLGKPEQFISDDGVFSKSTLDFGSRVLLETVVERELKGRLLDLGCGLGYMGILLKKYHPDLSVTLADINQLAVELAQENSRRYHQDNAAVVSDGFAEIDGDFDVIVFNPPIRTGKQNIYRLFEQCVSHLSASGRLYIVIRKKQGAESALNYLSQLAQAMVINRENGYWIIEVAKLTD